MAVWFEAIWLFYLKTTIIKDSKSQLMILIIYDCMYCCVCLCTIYFTFKSIFVFAFPFYIQNASCFPVPSPDYLILGLPHAHIWKNPVPYYRNLGRYVYCINHFDCIVITMLNFCIFCMWWVCLQLPPVLFLKLVFEWTGLIPDVWQENCIKMISVCCILQDVKLWEVKEEQRYVEKSVWVLTGFSPETFGTKAQCFNITYLVSSDNWFVGFDVLEHFLIKISAYIWH
jgi:hypothetical protein